MIKSIRVKNVATYGSCPEELEDLAEINFIYGSNGTGKTTISRVVADAGLYPDCEVTWYGALPVETLVYNRDFVERNFNQSDELKGIFTLGEKDKEILDKITVAQKELGLIERNIEMLLNLKYGFCPKLCWT